MAFIGIRSLPEQKLRRKLLFVSDIVYLHTTMRYFIHLSVPRSHHSNHPKLYFIVNTMILKSTSRTVFHDIIIDLSLKKTRHTHRTSHHCMAPREIYVAFLHDRSWISPWMKSISNELDITSHVIASQLSRYGDVISNRLWHHQQNEDRVG